MALIQYMLKVLASNSISLGQPKTCISLYHCSFLFSKFEWLFVFVLEIVFCQVLWDFIVLLC